MNGSRVVVRILGPVQLEGPDGPVALAGTLPRGFLAVLALEAPRPVSIDRLTSLLWAEQPPAGVKVALQQLASRVRRALVAAGLPDALRAVAPGYALTVDPSAIDLRVFRAAVRDGVTAAATGDHERAIAELTKGLDLWRGAAMADLIDLPLGELLQPAMDDERWRAEEQRAEAMLTVGHAQEAAHLLAAATADAPLRERLWVLRSQA
ncbi:MAG: BTAD domain-containing putative transcriptional regulator, partial [Ilumatobacteraceae bacterium]